MVKQEQKKTGGTMHWKYIIGSYICTLRGEVKGKVNQGFMQNVLATIILHIMKYEMFS